MAIQTHTILLESRRHFQGRLPTHHVGKLLVDLPLAIRGAVSMAFRNRSRAKGRKPDWLMASSDIRFTGHCGNGESQLSFELPTLQSAAGDLYGQKVLFQGTRPEGSLTGLDLLARAIDDVTAEKSDSDAFDFDLLNQIGRFGRFFKNGPFTELRIVGSIATGYRETPVCAAIDERTRAITVRTPRPQRTRLVGQLDGLEASTQRFSLLLDGGERVVGVFPTGHEEHVQALWNSRVLVTGTAVYRSSGDLLRVDADEIDSGEGASILFTRIPRPSHAILDTDRLRRPQGSRSGMAAIMGKWPGEETDEEVESALERMS